jgi:hypothetical protein
VHFGHHAVNLRPLIGLGGVLVAAMNAEFNELNMASALVDMCGAFGISRAPGARRVHPSKVNAPVSHQNRPTERKERDLTQTKTSQIQ